MRTLMLMPILLLVLGCAAAGDEQSEQPTAPLTAEECGPERADSIARRSRGRRLELLCDISPDNTDGTLILQ